MRRAAKNDLNQSAIVNALRKIPGVTVEPGHDDFLCGYKGKTYWFELKSERAVSKRTGLVREKSKKESQIKLEANWKGHYSIVSTLDEILKELEVI